MSHLPVGPSSDLPPAIRVILNDAIERGLTEKEVKQLIPSKWFWQGPFALNSSANIEGLKTKIDALLTERNAGATGTADVKIGSVARQELIHTDAWTECQAALSRAIAVAESTPSKVAAQERWIDWFTNGLMQIGICLHLVSDRAQLDHAVGLLAKLCNNMASGIHIEGYKDVSVADMKKPEVVLEALKQIIDAGVVPCAVTSDSSQSQAPASSYENARLAEKWGPSLQAMDDMLEAMQQAQERISLQTSISTNVESLSSKTNADSSTPASAGTSAATVKDFIQPQLQLWQDAQKQKPLTAGELRDCFKLKQNESFIWEKGVKKSFADENQKALYGENGGSSTNNAKDLVQNRLVGMLPKQLEESFTKATQGLQLPEGLNLKEAARALFQNQEGLEEFVRVLAILQFASKAEKLTEQQKIAIAEVEFGEYTEDQLAAVVVGLRVNVPGLGETKEEMDRENALAVQVSDILKNGLEGNLQWGVLVTLCTGLMTHARPVNMLFYHAKRATWDTCMQAQVEGIQSLFSRMGNNTSSTITITCPRTAAWGQDSATVSKFLQILGALYAIGKNSKDTSYLSIRDLDLNFAKAKDADELNPLLDAALQKLAESYKTYAPPPSPPPKKQEGEVE